MPRPRKCRRVCALPATTEFIPCTRQAVTDHITLTVEEYETIRLIDYEGYAQEQCGEQMAVARATVQQMYASARRKLAEALVEGCTIRIGGGDYQVCDGTPLPCGCPGCQRHKQPPMDMIRKGAMIMRIAVTYDQGQIFQHFGHTQAFKLYDVADGKVAASVVVQTDGQGHGALAGMLARMNVDALICGGIGGGAQMALAQAGIRLYGGASGDADEAVAALLAGELAFDPNVHCDHHGEHHHDDGHACGEHGCGQHDCGHGCH